MAQPKLEPRDISLFESEEKRTDHVLDVARQLYEQDEDLQAMTTAEQFLEQIWTQVHLWEDDLVLGDRMVRVYLMGWITE